jgi:hypothetical protein
MRDMLSRIGKRPTSEAAIRSQLQATDGAASQQ